MSRVYSSDVEEHIETRFIYWLDAEVNKSDHNKIVQKQLRAVSKDLQIFDDQNQCQQTIESCNEQDQIILIVSGRMGREIVPKIHRLQQILSIYVYCQDKLLHEEWTKHFFKVREVIIDLNQLISEIQFAQYSRLKTEALISYNIYNRTGPHERSMLILNKNFAQSFMLINALLRLECSTDDDRQEFISFCKKENRERKNQLKLIEEFSKTYQPSKILWWYTRDAFLYRIFDQILRSANKYFEQLLSSRSFLTDIYDQLKQNQYQSSVRVYSAQWMLSGEIELLRRPQSQYFAINTFWLTNTNQNKVVDSLADLTRGYQEQQVLFIIDAEPNLDNSKPFADISKLCHFDEGGEILFMIGSVFRIIDVIDDGEMSIVQMKLCSDNEKVDESMEIIAGNERINFRTFGDLLYRMELYDLAEQTYQQLLAKLPSNDPTRSDCYFAVAAAYKGRKEYDSSLKFYKKVLKRTDSSDYLMIGKLHACIGEIHRLKDNDKEALKCFEKAIEIYTKSHAEYHPHMADFYDNAAAIYKQLKQNNDALNYYKKALAVDERQLPSNSFGAAKSHNNIGIIYSLLNQYDRALEHYQSSLIIKLNTHPLPQHSIAKSYMNIASVYKTMDDLENALENYQKAEIIYKNLLPNQHVDLTEIENEIRMISQRRN